jgi:hypothetical protein
MLYDLNNPLQAENFRLRCDALLKKQRIVELTEKKPIRSLSQNAYLHVCLSYFASVTGNTMEYVKQHYFKHHCNKDIFLRRKFDKLLNRETAYLRSSATLDSAEMTTAIERFRDWSAQEAEIYIPDASDYDLIRQMEIEIERNKSYL